MKVHYMSEKINIVYAFYTLRGTPHTEPIFFSWKSKEVRLQVRPISITEVPKRYFSVGDRRGYIHNVIGGTKKRKKFHRKQNWNL